jgi:hypothetical protein
MDPWSAPRRARWRCGGRVFGSIKTELSRACRAVVADSHYFDEEQDPDPDPDPDPHKGETLDPNPH